MATLDEMPTPTLLAGFTLTVVPGETTEIGRLATGGRRVLRSYSGGSFAGDRLHGRLIGGSEVLLHRPDGVTTIEANFYVKTAAGEAVRLIGTGYATGDGPFVGTRMTIVFEADEDGACGWLTTRAFVGERSDGSDVLTIFEIG